MSDNNYKSDMSIDERVMMAIVRVAERFKKSSSSIVRNWDLTFSQYNVLRVLDASKNGQNTMKNVNRIMLISGANMTGIAKRLEKKGLIVRTSDSRDDRLKTLQITSEGTRVLRDISMNKDQNLGKYLMEFSNDQKSSLLEILREILKLNR